MAGIGAIPHDALAGYTVLGELGLDGSLAPVAGVLPAAIGANTRGEGLMCRPNADRKPPGRAPTWRSSPRPRSSSSPTTSRARRCCRTQPRFLKQEALLDLADIKARRAPNARSKWQPADTICSWSDRRSRGKVCWRRGCLRSCRRWRRRTARSLHGGLGGGRDRRRRADQPRPFRAPHHSPACRRWWAAACARPGEMSLAHHGVLFLVELPEFGGIM